MSISLLNSMSKRSLPRVPMPHDVCMFRLMIRFLSCFRCFSWVRPQAAPDVPNLFLGPSLEGIFSPWGFTIHFQAHFRWGSRVKILTSQIMSSLFSSLFWSEPIDFPFEVVLCRFSFNVPHFGLGQFSQGQGFNLWPSSNRIALFHWTLDLGCSSKVASTLCAWVSR
jgi:hypothetical protein